MVVGKNIFSQNYLIESLKKKEIKREYEAIVSGTILNKKGTINKPIQRHSYNRTRMTIDSNGKKAITYYNVIENLKNCTRIKVKLETGRTHQIRVHMNYIGHPIVGDKIYRNILKCNFYNKNLQEKINKFPRQALHSNKISLFHPITKKLMIWKICLPNDMKNLLHILKI